MANTNALKSVIEPAILSAFWSKIAADPIKASSTLRALLMGMQFDGIGVRRADRKLIIAEVTVSGFQGHRGNNFHVGAVRKLADAFSRFSILNHPSSQRELLAQMSVEIGAPVSSMECHFVVPEGSRFINALGYRTRLFEMGLMTLTPVSLAAEHMTILEQVLTDARAEMRGTVVDQAKARRILP